MTDERPYGRHFAPHDKGGYTEEAQPLDCSAKPIDPEEPIQEFDQYDYEPSSGAAEFNACSEYIKSGAEVAGQALGHADQRDSKRSRKRHFGIAVLAALLIIGLISAGIAFFINYSIGEGKRKFEDSMLHMFDKGGSIIEHDGVEYRLNENMVTVAFAVVGLMEVLDMNGPLLQMIAVLEGYVVFRRSAKKARAGVDCC